MRGLRSLSPVELPSLTENLLFRQNGPPFMGISKTNPKDLVYLGELLRDGKVVPVIDRYYPLSEVAAAIRYLVEEHAQGKVVITVEQNN